MRNATELLALRPPHRWPSEQVLVLRGDGQLTDAPGARHPLDWIPLGGFKAAKGVPWRAPFPRA
eukprot:5147393-Prymnesium_polylepis.1